MTQRLRHFIGGEWTGDGPLQERRNPSDTRDLVAEFVVAGTAEVSLAAAAARSAFPAWAAATPEARADLLDRVGIGLARRSEAIGELIAREEGKTRPEAVAEVLRAARIFRYFAGEALRAHGRTLPSVRAGVDAQTSRHAVGVFGLVTPWNFPIAIPAWKTAPALAFGNTVVLKPAPESPSVAVALAEAIAEAGAPPGVFNLLIGDGPTGAALVDAPQVDGISFTGSQKVGASVVAAAAARQARVQLEMGGKNPLLVMEDADLDRAVEIALDGGFLSTGQRCTASSRLIVQAAVHDEFVARLSERVAALRVGDARDPRTQIGPAVSAAQQEKDYAYIEIARREGGRIAAGGERLSGPAPGWWVRPTLVVETDPAMRVNQEEVFGPVASTLRVSGFEEGLELANAGEFGLSAGIVTGSLKYAREFQTRVKAGMTMVNLPTAGVDYHLPFGGSRRSSYGAREQGFAAVEFFTQTKTSYLCA